MYAYTCIRMFLRTPHTHSRTHTHTHARTHALIHVCIHICMCAHTCARTHTKTQYTHTETQHTHTETHHTHVHTNKYLHTHTCVGVSTQGLLECNICCDQRADVRLSPCKHSVCRTCLLSMRHLQLPLLWISSHPHPVNILFRSPHPPLT